MTNKEAIIFLKWQVVYAKETGERYITDCVNVEALALAVKALEKNNEMLEYLKACLSQSDEFKEKHRNVDDDGLKEHHKRMAIIFEGMGEAYADLIDRFFKEDYEHDT